PSHGTCSNCLSSQGGRGLANSLQNCMIIGPPPASQNISNPRKASMDATRSGAVTERGLAVVADLAPRSGAEAVVTAGVWQGRKESKQPRNIEHRTSNTEHRINETPMTDFPAEAPADVADFRTVGKTASVIARQRG